MNPRRARVLAELGLVRYRLRAAPVAAVAVPVATTPVMAPRVLGVYAPDAQAAPVDGTAAAIWRQVLAWLRLAETEVRWLATPEAGSVPLPALREWSLPQGKRALWSALSAFAAGRAG